MNFNTRRDMQERRAEQYRALKSARPDLYEKAIQIGSLVMCSSEGYQLGGSQNRMLLSLAARIEGAVIDAFLQNIESEQRQ